MPVLKPSRRDILKIAAASPSLALPSLARAGIGLPAGVNASHFRFTVGSASLTVISDGHFTTPVSLWHDRATEAEVAEFMERYFLSSTEEHRETNHILIEKDDAKIIVDVGSGGRFIGETGKLLQNLEAAGIDPYDITHVVMTHGHQDHIWGMRDDFDEAIFPEAEYIISEAEYDFWMQDGLVDAVPEEDQQMVVGAINSLNTDGVEWTLASDGHEVVSGVRLVALFGHTPGHAGLLVEDGDESLLILGDAVSHAHISFERPEWTLTRDMDADATISTRLKMLDMVSSDRVAVAGYHLPFPGIGHVLREGDAYRFVPALWRN